MGIEYPFTGFIFLDVKRRDLKNLSKMDEALFDSEEPIILMGSLVSVSDLMVSINIQVKKVTRPKKDQSIPFVEIIDEIDEKNRDVFSESLSKIYGFIFDAVVSDNWNIYGFVHGNKKFPIFIIYFENINIFAYTITKVKDDDGDLLNKFPVSPN